jgi:O-antigen/teichoic acid export membrane protein
MMALSNGETAILKATRQVGTLARIQVLTVVAGVFISIPLYYFFRHSGVVPALVLMALSSMLLTMRYSYHSYPLRLSFRKSMLREGASMLKVGLAFVLAAAIGSGSEMFVRSFLNVEGDMDAIGFYNAAYMISITYAGMVFSSMESDFFPRLSAVSKDVCATNETVNKQIEVSLLILSPMLVALLTMLPVLVPLLFTADFFPVVGMAQLALLAMYFKVLTLPVAYITLARSASLSFLLLETLYFVFFVVAMVFGFMQWGIYGTGVAIVAAHVFDYLLINCYAYRRYGYRCTLTIGRYVFVQLSIGLLAFLVSLYAEGWLYWITEAALTIASTAYSVSVLRSKTRLWEALLRKFGF